MLTPLEVLLDGHLSIELINKELELPRSGVGECLHRLLAVEMDSLNPYTLDEGSRSGSETGILELQHCFRKISWLIEGGGTD